METLPRADAVIINSPLLIGLFPEIDSTSSFIFTFSLMSRRNTDIRYSE